MAKEAWHYSFVTESGLFVKQAGNRKLQLILLIKGGSSHGMEVQLCWPSPSLSLSHIGCAKKRQYLTSQWVLSCPLPSSNWLLITGTGVSEEETVGNVLRVSKTRPNTLDRACRALLRVRRMAMGTVASHSCPCPQEAVNTGSSRYPRVNPHT